MGKGCYALHPPHKSEVANADRVGAYHNSGTQVVIPHIKQTLPFRGPLDLQKEIYRWQSAHGHMVLLCNIVAHMQSLLPKHIHSYNEIHCVSA